MLTPDEVKPRFIDRLPVLFPGFSGDLSLFWGNTRILTNRGFINPGSTSTTH